jgi:hypothetical protein
LKFDAEDLENITEVKIPEKGLNAMRVEIKNTIARLKSDSRCKRK